MPLKNEALMHGVTLVNFENKGKEPMTKFCVFCDFFSILDVQRKNIWLSGAKEGWAGEALHGCGISAWGEKKVIAWSHRSEYTQTVLDRLNRRAPWYRTCV